MTKDEEDLITVVKNFCTYNKYPTAIIPKFTNDEQIINSLVSQNKLILKSNNALGWFLSLPN